jgi:hypothetical protein
MIQGILLILAGLTLIGLAYRCPMWAYQRARKRQKTRRR